MNTDTQTAYRSLAIRFTIRRPDSAQYEQVRERLEELKP